MVSRFHDKKFLDRRLFDDVKYHDVKCYHGIYVLCDRRFCGKICHDF